MSVDCKACNGTGRFRGVYAGPAWPQCPECNGTGKEDGPSEDTMLERYIVSAMAAHSLTLENDQLRAALQRIADNDVAEDLKGRADVLSGIAWAALSPKSGEGQ